MRHMLGTYLNMQEKDVDTLGHSQEKVKCVPKHIPVAAYERDSKHDMKCFQLESILSKPSSIVCMLYRYKERNINV